MIQVRTLGTAEVLVGERRIAPDSTMLFALALFLSVSAGERVRRSRLLELFWPDASDRSRRHALRQLLYRLRRDGFSLALDGEELLVDGNGVESDIRRVLASHWPDEANEAEVVAAARVLPGYEPPMPEPYREWLDELRARVNSQYRRAVLRQIDTARRDGRWYAVDDWASRCLDVDPLNEEATLAHAEAIAMRGSKAQALQVIDEYLHELGDRDRLIGLPARVLRRRVSENAPERPRGEAEVVPLIGRQREVARLLEILGRTVPGCGSALLLEGTAGIGKSRLAQELLATAAMRGWRTVTTQLQVSDVQRPLGVFVDMFSALLQVPGALGCSPESLSQLRLLTEHDVRAGAEAERSQEAEAVQERLRSAAGDLLESVASENPLVLLIDDLHWCDSASERLLQHLVSRSAHLPVLWTFTSRRESRYGALREAMRDLRVEVVNLPPLAPDDASTLFALLSKGAAGGAEAPANAVTGGNPLFVLELARHLRATGETASLPHSLRSLIRDRAARLSPLAAQLLHTCAVLGRYASVPRVAGVLETGTADLLRSIGELDALGIVGTGHDGQALAIHDLWREELLRTLQPASERLLQYRCGVVLEHECRASRSPAVVWEAARHFLAGDSEERAIGLLLESAQHQMDNGLAADAARTFELAAESASSDADRLRAMKGAITAHRRAADWNEIARIIGPAIVLAANTSAIESNHSDLELLQMEVRWHTESDPLSGLAQALTCADDETAPSSHRVSASLLAAIFSANVARLRELRPVLEKANRLSQRSIEDRINVLAMNTIYHTEAGDLDVALEQAAGLVAAERDRGSIRGLARALRFASYPLRCTGDFEGAMSALRESLELAESHRLVGDAATASDSIVNLCLEQGDFGAAQRWVGRAKSWSSQISTTYARTGASINDAIIAIAVGNCDAVATLIDQNIETHARDPIVRQKLLSLAVLAQYLAIKKDRTRLQRTCNELGMTLQAAATIGRVDYAVSAFAAGLVELGNWSDAADFVRFYVQHARRDRFSPARPISAFLARAE